MSDMRKGTHGILFAAAVIFGWVIVISYCGCAAAPGKRTKTILTVPFEELVIPPTPTPSAFKLAPLPPMIIAGLNLQELRDSLWSGTSSAAIGRRFHGVNPDALLAGIRRVLLEAAAKNQCWPTTLLAEQYQIDLLAVFREQCMERDAAAPTIELDWNSPAEPAPWLEATKPNKKETIPRRRKK